MCSGGAIVVGGIGGSTACTYFAVAALAVDFSYNLFYLYLHSIAGGDA